MPFQLMLGSDERRHLAASEGSWSVSEWLLSYGADINALDRFKRTPLEVCRNAAPSLWFPLFACCIKTPSRNGAHVSAKHVAQTLQQEMRKYSCQHAAAIHPEATGCTFNFFILIHGASKSGTLQDAVRGEYHDLAKLIINKGGLIWTDNKVIVQMLSGVSVQS